MIIRICYKSAADLLQDCWNKLVSRCVRSVCSQIADNLSTVFGQLVISLLTTTHPLQVIPTTYQWLYSSTICEQPFIDNLLQLNKIVTIGWKACYRPVALQIYLVDTIDKRCAYPSASKRVNFSSKFCDTDCLNISFSHLSLRWDMLLITWYGSLLRS